VVEQQGAGRVDPRVCGGAVTRQHQGRSPPPTTPLSEMGAGRSPRVRGSLRARSPRVRGRSLRHAAARRVDPRVCGGAKSTAIVVLLRVGRSPRVRGSRRARRASETARGRVDPRVCGGAPMRARPEVRRDGSIPACAGEPTRTLRARASPAHGDSGSIPACAGEPTDAWGGVCGGPRGGSIPACAGEPRVRRPIPACRATRRSGAKGRSPRVRGSRPAAGDGRARPPSRGRSPRVRGSPTPCGPTSTRHGSIPACAGEPRAAARVESLGRSPRVRGSLFDLFAEPL
jgi:hypothetical protein